MTLDLIFGSALLLLIFLGWRRGALRQAARLGAAVGVMLFAPALSEAIKEMAFPDAPVAAPLLEACSLLGAAILIYVTLALAGWVIVKSIHGLSDTLSATDHVAGALLGAIKTMVMVYVIATSALWAGPWLERIDPGDHMHLRDGETTAFVRTHNVLAPWKFPDVERLHRAIQIANSSPIPYDLIRAEPSGSKLLRQQRFKELAAQKALQQAAKDQEFAVTLSHEQVRAFLNDPAMTKLLRETDWKRMEELTKQRVEKGR